ncbi:sugar phosphate permease [Breoghania corrubedonensis]|uniref:Sugar phosphate permease n=1 Tax=Breoghania corrubedonensis TaxID=665038 RepID=A0A2T5V6S8_9HYPH|nr:sugar phosphate permease [Breoghania corrubedonensis]
MEDNVANSQKYRVLGGSFAAYTFDAFDLLLLAMAFQPIMNDLSLTRSEAGMLATATLVGVGFSSVLMGWYSDNYGRRKAMLWSLISFSLLTMLIAVAQTWTQILILRFLAGLGLGGLWGVIAAYIAETFPPKQRGRAAAFVMSSFPVGVGLASFLAGKIIPAFGWRALFLTAGAALIVAAYVFLFVKESEVWKEQREARRTGTHTAPEKVSVGEIFRDGMARNTIIATAISALALFAYWGTTSWLPTYLVKERGLSVADMGMFMTILSVGMFFGYNLFGWLADIIGKRNALALSLCGSGVMLAIYAMTENPTMLMWMGPAYAFFMAFVGLMGSYYGELYPVRVRTTGSGFCFNVGRGVSAFAPLVLGGLATTFSLQTLILLCSIPFLAAGLLTLLLPPSENLRREETGPKKQPVPVR